MWQDDSFYLVYYTVWSNLEQPKSKPSKQAKQNLLTLKFIVLNRSSWSFISKRTLLLRLAQHVHQWIELESVTQRKALKRITMHFGISLIVENFLLFFLHEGNIIKQQINSNVLLTYKLIAMFYFHILLSLFFLIINQLKMRGFCWNMFSNLKNFVLFFKMF